jgi:hypothetical protein
MRERGQEMDSKEAIKYLNMVKDSFDHATAPKFSKESIGQEREKASKAIDRAIQLLEKEAKI